MNPVRHRAPARKPNARTGARRPHGPAGRRARAGAGRGAQRARTTTSSSPTTWAAGSSGAASRCCCWWRRWCSPAACRTPCSADGHRHHRLPLVQHAARAGRHAQLRARGVLGHGRLPGDPHAQPGRQGRMGGAGEPDPGGGRRLGGAVRRALRLRDHQEGRDALRHDHAGHRRAGVGLVADVPRVLRRRGRHLGQPGRRPEAAGHPSGRRSSCTT